MFCLCPHPLTSKSHLKDTFLPPTLHLSSVEPCVQGRGRRGESALLESHSLGGVNTVSGPPPPVVGAHQINKRTNSQVNRNMFTRVEEKQPFGIAGAVASGTAAAAWDSSQGGGEEKAQVDLPSVPLQEWAFPSRGEVCMYERERERLGEGERDAKGDGEREETQGDSDRGAAWWRRSSKAVAGEHNPSGFGFESHSQELGVLDLAPCPL